MARLFPERLQQSIADDAGREGERRVYASLGGLSNQYCVFYSVHWEHQAKGGWGIKEGEADFVIAHPQKGIIILEVKGGEIQFVAEKGEWHSIERRSRRDHVIKDPVEQASRNHHELEHQLNKLPEWSNEPLNIGHAVCFPDVAWPNEKKKTDLPREIIIDCDDLQDIESTIDRLYKALFGKRNGSPGKKRFQLLVNYLAGSFTFRSPLGVELESQEKKLIELTEQQYEMLSLLRLYKRVAIAGCAGSGKTMLAVRKAQQFAESGMRVLMTCFNIPLAEDLQEKIQGVEVQCFHALCEAAAQRCGLQLQNNNDQDYYNHVLPDALLTASDQIGRRYDAIIVDEGQDFHENYWIALESLLKDDGYLYIFYDDNQNLYSGSADFGGLITLPPFSLTRNCRNTKPIHQMVVRFHQNPQGLSCPGPEGQPLELIACRGYDEQTRSVQKLLYRLVNEEHISCEDIVILTPRGKKTTLFKPGTQLGSFRLTDVHTRRPLSIQVSSVYRFKGLERRVVILAEVDERMTRTPETIMYVACSRALTHLVIVYDENCPPEILRLIQEPFS